MTCPSDAATATPTDAAGRLAALSPEERERIGTAMRFLADLKKLYAEGLDAATDMLEGRVRPAAVAMRLADFERNLRLAADALPRRPFRVAHAEAVRKGQTKLDEAAWLKQVRTKAAEARVAREEEAREARLRPAPKAEAVVDCPSESTEAELVAGPCP